MPMTPQAKRGECSRTPAVRAECTREVLADGAVRFVLPWPPPLNNIYQTDFRTRRRFLSKRGKEFKDATACLLICAKPWLGPISLIITQYRPRKCGDIDGAIKPVMDALKGVVYHDDEQVTELTVSRDDDKAHPRVIVIARPVKEADEN